MHINSTHYSRHQSMWVDITRVHTVCSHKCPLLVHHTLRGHSSNCVVAKQICDTGFHKDTGAIINAVHNLAIPPPNNSLDYVKVDCG